MTEVIKKASAKTDPQVLGDLGELEAALCSESVRLSEQLLHDAFQEMEAVMFDRILSRLRSEMPTLIERVLQEHTNNKT